MRQRIADAHDLLDKAARDQSKVTEPLDKAINEHAQIHADCQREMLTHLYQTAGLMDQKQAARYLEVMLPYALNFSHSEPENAHVR